MTTLTYSATDNAGKQEQPNSETGSWAPAVGHAPFRILIISDLMVDRCNETESSRGQDH